MPIDTDRIQKSIRKLRKFLKRSPKRPSSSEIHDLRTNARRFEAAVEALALDRGKNQRRLLRDLGRVRKRAGKVRDMDVLTGFTLTINLEGEQDCVVQLLETLGTDRTKYAKKLRGVVDTVGPRLRRRLKRCASMLQNAVEEIPKKRVDPQASTEAMARAFRLSEELNEPARLNKTNLHPYRLKVKDLRYILQLAEDANQHELVDKLGKVKDAIGEWHDWEELCAIAKDVLDDHGAKCKLLPKLVAISETKYDEALSLAEHIRKVFLDSTANRRGRERGRKTPRIRPPVLAAVSAISA